MYKAVAGKEISKLIFVVYKVNVCQNCLKSPKLSQLIRKTCLLFTCGVVFILGCNAVVH